MNDNDTGNNSPTYWRSLAELQRSPEFEEFLRREFPVGASEFPRGLSRRRWLQLMGASFALAGLSGCRRWDAETFAPHAVRPEHRAPGETVKYATNVELAGAPRHLLATSYDGRPIKIEGNPDHPVSRGASDLYSQAMLLQLYDPDRSHSVRQRVNGQFVTKAWPDFEQFARSHFAQLKQRSGKQLALLLEPTTSLAMHDMVRRFRAAFPEAGVFQHAALDLGYEQAGAQLAFGKPQRTQLHLDKAQTIVALDADLLHDHPAALPHARDFVAGRDPDAGHMNRLFVIESQYTITGAAADHRFPLSSHRIGAALAMLASKVRTLLELGNGAAESTPTHEHSKSSFDRFINVLAAELVAHRGASVITVGSRQPAPVHAMAHGLNVLLGNAGKTISYYDDPTVIEGAGTLEELSRRMRDGQVDTLVILGSNPHYDAPADLAMDEAFQRVPHAIHLGLYEDETANVCQWHLPAAHPLEIWSDVRAVNGLVGVGQPLIAPLLGGRSSLELLALLLGDDQHDGQAIVRRAVADHLGDLDDPRWRRLVHDGFLDGTEYPAVTMGNVADAVFADLNSANPISTPDDDNTLEIVFTPSDTLYDGRFANNGWLQETPDFLTTLVWDNAAIIHPGTAKRLGIEQGQLVRIELDGRSLTAPAYLLPGQARHSIGLAIGHGRPAAGHVGGLLAEGIQPAGVNAHVLQRWDARGFAVGAKLIPLAETYTLATTQDHHAIDTLGLQEIGHRVGQLVREASLEHYQQHPDFVQHGSHHPELKSLWEEPSYEGAAWGMAIDLNKCLGCNACMVACQAENNVPVVGKEQVLQGREMHWIRVDRYFHGDIDTPQTVNQPVACQHCENAPCEQVCPVAATVHSSEGLNDMVYNRCIGTRYCANNCPYKVRRFNFFDFNEQLENANNELMRLVINPEVSVRARGVMEKCTYCVQRIQAAKIDAKVANRPIADGDILTACQQACPTRAIEFGDLNLNGSRVSQAHRNQRAYALLGELNVKPRTMYLARIRNPHPELADAAHTAEVTVSSHHS